MAQALAYPLRLPDEMMDKLKVIAKDNGRSVNKEIELLVRQSIKQYEQENGEITLASPE